MRKEKKTRNKKQIDITNNKSVFYENSNSIASIVSFHVRKKIFNFFMKKLSPTKDTKVLDVGVTCDETFKESNFFEKLYPYPENITCVGTEDGSYLEKKYKNIKYIHVNSNESLPFKNKVFDIVFSNAVIEHAGSWEDQKFFISELCRVGKRIFVITPNRWFPIEPHTHLPLIHFLPKIIFRRIIKNTRYSYWAEEKNLNFLSMRLFKKTFENKKIKTKSIRFCGITSNLIIYT